MRNAVSYLASDFLAASPSVSLHSRLYLILKPQNCSALEVTAAHTTANSSGFYTRLLLCLAAFVVHSRRPLLTISTRLLPRCTPPPPLPPPLYRHNLLLNHLNGKDSPAATVLSRSPRVRHVCATNVMYTEPCSPTKTMRLSANVSESFNLPLLDAYTVLPALLTNSSSVPQRASLPLLGRFFLIHVRPSNTSGRASAPVFLEAIQRTIHANFQLMCKIYFNISYNKYFSNRNTK